MKINVAIVSGKVHGKKVVSIAFDKDEVTMLLNFEDMKTLLDFTVSLIEEGAKMWPDHPASVEYRKE